MSALPTTIPGFLPYRKPSTKGNAASVLPNNQIQVKKVTYPDSDGKPMADNTRQYKEIVTLVENFNRIFKNNPFIFVAGDLLWYTVEGKNKIRQAPDVMVVFGRPPAIAALTNSGKKTTLRLNSLSKSTRPAIDLAK